MHHSQPLSTNAATQLGPQFAVLRLHSWPDLEHISEGLIPDVIRICALLAVRPTGAPLIHRLLEMPKDRAQHVVDMLFLHGHLSDAATQNGGAAKPDAKHSYEFDNEEPEFKISPSTVRDFLERFRKKLLPAGAR